MYSKYNVFFSQNIILQDIQIKYVYNVYRDLGGLEILEKAVLTVACFDFFFKPPWLHS